MNKLERSKRLQYANVIALTKHQVSSCEIVLNLNAGRDYPNE